MKTLRKLIVRVILDNCSNITVLRQEIAELLDLGVNKVDMKFTTTGGAHSLFKNQDDCEFRLISLDGSFKTPPIQSGTLPEITPGFKPIVIDPEKFDHLKGIKNWTENYKSRTKRVQVVSLLLGQPYESWFGQTSKSLGAHLGDPILIHTPFGPCISAPMNLGQKLSHSNDCSEDFKMNAEKEIIRWMQLEAIGISDCPTENNELTFDELECQKKIDNGTTYDESTKTYTTCLPWRSEKIQETNQARAHAASISWAKRLANKDPKLLDMWMKTYAEGVAAGFFGRVPPDDLKKTSGFHYIQTFPVAQYHKNTHPVRLCFMANQTQKTSGKSLNEMLLPGANLLKDLVLLVIKFRSFPYVFNLDISRMFHRFRLNTEDQDLLRFYLVRRDENGVIRHEPYRCLSLPFGLNSSVFTSIYLMRSHAKKYLQTRHKNAAAQLLDFSYMDDILLSADSEQNLSSLVRDARKILEDASLPTHKYISNSKQVLADFPKELISAKTRVSVLGSIWDAEKDELTFNLIKPPNSLEIGEDGNDGDRDKSDDQNLQNCYDTRLTKRSLLSTLAKVFDSQGFVSPLIFRQKLLVQKSWELGLTWDQPLPEELAAGFKSFLSELPLLEKIVIPRCFLQTEDSKVSEICSFGDASIHGYSAVVYIVTTTPSGTRSANLALAKTRVRPLGKRLQKLTEQMSVCRLELLAALAASIAGNFVKQAFPDEELKMRYFSDSQVTLHRLQNDHGIYRPFVANRLRQIKELTKVEDWNYVTTEENTGADICSRGSALADFIDNPRWWTGPQFLTTRGHDYGAMNIKNMQLKKNIRQMEEEERKIQASRYLFSSHLRLMDPVDPAAFNEEEFTAFWDAKNTGLLRKFHSWDKIVRILARVLQFISATKEGWKRKVHKKPSGCHLDLKIEASARNRKILESHVLTRDQLEDSRKLLFRLAQYTDFEQEIISLKTSGKVDRSSAISRLRPVWDEVDCLIRMTGRAPSSSLIILPKRNRISELFVIYCHKIHNHAGTNTLMARVETMGCYLVGGKTAYKHITMCCICRPPKRLFQQMADLPLERMATSTRSHYAISLDYAGPYFVKKGSKNDEKVWVLVTSCLVTRYIHVEVVRNCTTAAFIDAFRAYTALFGIPLKCYSDNATYFKSGSGELRQILRGLDWAEIRQKTNGVTFEFFCPLASSKAGVIEICVKLFKKSLDRALNFTYKGQLTPRPFDADQFRIICLEMAAYVNDRPLGPISWDREGCSELAHVSPSQLVRGRSNRILPAGMKLKDVIDESRHVAKIYNHRAKVLRLFFNEFLSNYQRSLKFTPKWLREMKNDIPIGTLVLLKDPSSMKPGNYNVAVVTGVHRRENGAISRLQVKTKENKNPVFRDIRQISMLEHDFLTITSPTHRCLIKDLERDVEIPAETALLTMIADEDCDRESPPDPDHEDSAATNAVVL